MEDMIKMAERITELREIMEFSKEEVAAAIGVTLDQYADIEAGKTDLSFTMLSRLAKTLRVDLTDLVSGESPRLAVYSLTRAGGGTHLERHDEYQYELLFEQFTKRACDTFVVRAAYEAEDLHPVTMYRHEGQEINFMLQGQMRFFIDEKTEDLNPGDAVYFDATHPHAMRAMGGEDADFLSVIVKPKAEE